MDLQKAYRESGSVELHRIGEAIRAQRHQEHMLGAKPINPETGESPANDQTYAIAKQAQDLADSAAKHAEDVSAYMFLIRELNDKLGHLSIRCFKAEREVIELRQQMSGRKLPDPSAIHSAIGAV